MIKVLPKQLLSTFWKNRKKARERIEARKQAKKRRRQQAIDDLIYNKLGMRYIANQIEILDKRYGGRYHAPPEVINEWLSQFKTEFGDSPCLDEKEVALRMKKQKEWEEFMQDDFLNRLKSKNRWQLMIRERIRIRKERA